MYYCKQHGWTSMNNPCPTCNPVTVTTASGLASPVIGLDGEVKWPPTFATRVSLENGAVRIVSDNSIPRRSRADLWEKQEIIIYQAIHEIEKMPPDKRLTDAVILLGKAKDLVSDFIDDEFEKSMKTLGSNR